MVSKAINPNDIYNAVHPRLMEIYTKLYEVNKRPNQGQVYDALLEMASAGFLAGNHYALESVAKPLNGSED